MPTAADNALINTTTPNPAVIGTGVTATAAEVRLGTASDANPALTITGGGKLTSTQGQIANTAGSRSAATVTGSGSRWDTSGTLLVGNVGTGTLTITDKGVVSAGSSFVGAAGGAIGIVTVSGAGTSWTSSGNQFIGSAGNGTLQILDGAVVTGGTTRVGDSGNSISSVLVSGAGSTWVSTASMTIGRLGRSNGTITVRNQGTVDARSLVGLAGQDVTSVGTVTVTDVGSKWISKNNNLLIGQAGTGTFTLSNGATAETAETVVGTNQDFSGVSPTGANGTLKIESGGLFSGRNVTVGLNRTTSGTVTVTGAGSLLSSTVSQTIGAAGSGWLYILGGATASAPVASIGTAAGSSGTTVIDGANSHWTLAGGLAIGTAGTGVLTLSSQAELSAAAIRLADQAGSTGTLNIGAAEGAAAAQAGSVNTGSISFGSGTGKLVLNHTDSAYHLSAVMSGAGSIRAEHGTTLLTSDSSGFLGNTAILSGATLQVGDGASSGAIGGAIANNGVLVFDRADDSNFAGVISGAGSLTKKGAGTLAVSGNSSAFTGASTLAAGGLALSGKLGGTLTAQAGTVLSGTGTVGGIVAQGGATISPGQASGSDVAALSVSGTYHQLSGSTYQAGLVPQGTVSDLIAVGGAATLDAGAVLNVTKLGSGVYGLNDSYTVLTAAGGVTGTYLLTGDTAVSEFYGLQAVYESDAVLLKVMQIRDFADVAQTPNQTATADGVSSLPAGNELRDALGSLNSGEEARQALDLLSGEIYASTAGAILQDSRFVRDAVLGRLRCANADPANSKDSDCLDRAVWIEGYGASGDNDSNGNAAAMDTTMEGFTIGADMALPGHGRLGVFGARGMSDVTVADRRSSASVESYDLGAYGGVSWNNFTLGLGGAYGWNNVTTNRAVSFQGFSDKLEADYQARMAQLFGEVGYTLSAGPAAFEPFARLAYANLQTDSFHETGGAAALYGGGQNNSVTLGTLGLRGSATTRVFDYEVTAKAMGGWQHGWGDLTPGMDVNFAGGSNFGIAGVPTAEDAALVEAGLTAEAPGEGAFSVLYTGQFSQNTQIQGLRAKLEFTF